MAPLVTNLRPQWVLPTFDAVHATAGQTWSGEASAIDQWLTQQTSAAQAFVVVNLGVNDILTGLPAQADEEASIAHVLDSIHGKWGTASILVVAPWAQGYDADSSTHASRLGDVLVSRNWAAIVATESTYLPGHIPDGVHPDATGYALWATKIQAAMGY
jgi:lysophospholipase L1-like esterase